MPTEKLQRYIHMSFIIFVLTFRALHGQAPQYLSDLLKPHSSSWALRSLDQRLLVVPRTRFKTRGDGAFQTVAPRLWNSVQTPLILLKNSWRHFYLEKHLINFLSCCFYSFIVLLCFICCFIYCYIVLYFHFLCCKALCDFVSVKRAI